MEIDWKNAPEWANYHAFDSDGRGGWHESKPKIGGFGLWWKNEDHSWPSTYTIPTGQNWRESLTKREEKQNV